MTRKGGWYGKGALCALLCTISVCRAQQPAQPVATQLNFTHLSVEDGLSQSSVISILQDSTGFMWFGTRSCLNRYDTRSFKVYRHAPGDSSSISSNDYIFALLRDHRNRVWIGTQRGLDLYLPERDAFEPFFHDTSRQGSISDSYINCLYEDHAGVLWVGTNNGLNRLVSEHPFRFELVHRGEVHAICEDRQGAIWFGTTDGLYKMGRSTGIPFFMNWQHHINDTGSLSCNSVTSLACDSKGELWVGTECGGVNVLAEGGRGFTHYLHKGVVRKILVDKEDNCWIGTIDGLYYFNRSDTSFTVYRNDPEDPYSLSNNSIRDLYIDRYGSLWVGTVFGGVCVSHAIATPFTVYRTSKRVNSIGSNVVSAMGSDERHNLWIGTEAEGLNYYDRRNHLFIHYKHDANDPGSLQGNFVKSICRDRQNRVWVGTYEGGLDLFEPSSGRFTHYRHDPADPSSLPGDNISCIMEDSHRRFWVGAYGKGLNLFDRGTGRCKTYTTDPASPLRISSNWVRLVFEDSQKNLWVGTAHGLNMLPDGGAQFCWFQKGAESRDSLVSDYINCMMEDRSGRVWIGTYDGGLSLYHPATRSFTTYTMQDGLPGNNVRGILEDGGGVLWLSTDNGLCRFDPLSHTVTAYNVYDGLPGNEFNYNSFYRDDDGQLFFGGYAGLVSFYPDRIRMNGYVPRMVFTGLKLFNQQVTIHDRTGLLERDISQTHAVTFSATQNIFTIAFAALNYIKSAKNKYAYKLEGFEDDWNYVATPSATYTNLPPGRYTFLVRGANNDGLWNPAPARMQIIVLPPPWKTWWAYLCYALTFCVLLYLVIRFFRRQARLERDLYYEHQRITQQQELHQMKLDFFTNISHEIRTPLTLITGPIESLLQRSGSDVFARRQLGLAKKNTDRLVRLVTELLDFRKAESGHMQLWRTRSNIVLFAREIVDSFSELASRRAIEYVFEPSEEVIMVSFDAAQIEKVLFNLLSNAFKFTEAGGQVHLSVRRVGGSGDVRGDGGEKDEVRAGRGADGAETVEITVMNTGKGIAPEHLAKLFERYYQAGASEAGVPGTGIGLALSRSIVELHGGRIEVGSEMGRTVFRIELPVGSDAVEEREGAADAEAAGDEFPVGIRIVRRVGQEGRQIAGGNLDSRKSWDGEGAGLVEDEEAGDVDGAAAEEEEERASDEAGREAAVEDHDRPTLLVVEDNPEIRQLVRDALSGQYNIEEAASGAMGWEAALRIIPDLVISDVMMEGVDDGFVLCQRIKTDERTSHIPLILLTARVAAVHQISGLQTGADAYITKPFHLQVLELQVRNLLSLRNIIRHKFSRQVTLQPELPLAPSPSAEFLEKLVAMVEEEMEDPAFGVPVLLRKVGMSQTVLYRKLKALTDMSIADFIKSVRLKKAAELLVSGRAVAGDGRAGTEGEEGGRVGGGAREDGPLSVVDVAYRVGFSDRKYFSKEFRKQFGQSPTAYQSAAATPKPGIDGYGTK